MRKRTDMNPEHRKIAGLRAKGQSYAVIAKKMGYSKSTIYKICKQADVVSKINELQGTAEKRDIERIADISKGLHDLGTSALNKIKQSLEENGIPPGIALNAAQDVLDRIGYAAKKKEERNLNINITLEEIQSLKEKVSETKKELKIIDI